MLLRPFHLIRSHVQRTFHFLDPTSGVDHVVGLAIPFLYEFSQAALKLSDLFSRPCEFSLPFLEFLTKGLDGGVVTNAIIVMGPLLSFDVGISDRWWPSAAFEVPGKYLLQEGDLE